MANSICGDNDASIVSVAAICGRRGWPIREPVSELPLELESTLQSHSAVDGEQKQPIEDTMSEDGHDDTLMVDTNDEAGSIKRSDWRRVRKYYECSKQYIFVAATLPVNGKKTTGAILKHMFTDAHIGQLWLVRFMKQ
ncbi:hypothetical protein K1719_046673 [Acacia pycnantha]|nr:hypothetical protein K1719_046673 [Acacia pycnantha]